jgi:hypothetical protein
MLVGGTPGISERQGVLGILEARAAQTVGGALLGAWECLLNVPFAETRLSQQDLWAFRIAEFYQIMNAWNERRMARHQADWAEARELMAHFAAARGEQVGRHTQRNIERFLDDLRNGSGPTIRPRQERRVNR